MASFENFIDRLKREVDLIEEINKTAGMAMQTQRRGKYVYGVPTSRGGAGDSLMVDVTRQSYYWWAKSGQGTGPEKGDVFNWLETYRKMTFQEALRYLCHEYNMALPEEFDREPNEKMKAYRARAELWEVVATWLCEQLEKSTPAMEYAKGRGWNDVTIRNGRLGYSPGGRGEKAKAYKEDLRGHLRMYGYDPQDPKLVAITGMAASRDELLAWGRKYDVEIQEHPSWLEKERIYGLLDFPRLVYVHRFRGNVEYFSARNLKWEGGRLIGEDGGYKSWNLPNTLAGERQYYYNEEYHPRTERAVVVEGNADAITWAQWGIPAVSLNGLGADEDLVANLQRHDVVFLGTDNGEHGRKAVDTLGRLIGPDCWVLHYPITENQGEDANDWLQRMVEKGATDIDRQKESAERVLERAELFAVRVTRQASQMTGPERVKAVEEAGALIRQLPENILSQYHKELRKNLDFGVREFNRVLSSMVSEEEKKSSEPNVEVTLGGVYGEWVVEYVYDPEEGNVAKLAYRSPQGEIGVSDSLMIDGIKYIPKPVNEFVERQAVLFPSALGEEMDTASLIDEVEGFINRYYLLDDPYLIKIIAYYVLLTWIYDAFEALPYLRALGDYGSGKSELMKRVGFICYRLITASGANTSATFFRTKEMYRGTVFIDEADLHDGGDMANDIVKFLNLGAMKGNVITRMAETTDYYGNKVLEPMPFDTFGPKLIAMREDFRDKAVGSRSLTIKVVGKSTEELMDAGIPLQIDDAFRKEAEDLRNMLLRWRLDHYVSNIDLGRDLVDINLSARLNQVTMAVKALAKIADDQGLMVEITRFLRAYAKDEIRERSLTMQAYIVEAIWELWKVRDEYLTHSLDGRAYFWMHDIRERANIILDSINEAGSVREEGGGSELTPQGVGHYLREDLQAEVGKRQGPGVPVYWDTKKMVRLGKKYGILDIDFEVEEEEN